MIAYSPDAEPARAYLLRAYNDIDIFVEDVSAQNVYVRLFGRILRGIATISQVYPLGNRQKVMEACAQDQRHRDRKRLYVIDADHDLIRGIPAPPINHLYRLGVYCSENLLLSEAAAIELAMESCTSETWADLALRLDLRNTMTRACTLLLPLFFTYALAEKFQLGLQTVKYPVQRLMIVPSDPATLSPMLIRNRVFTLRAEIVNAIGLQMYRLERNDMAAHITAAGPDISRYISGKSYLLPILHLHLIKIARLTGSLETLKVRLAQHCELTVDPGLTEALLAATAATTTPAAATVAP